METKQTQKAGWVRWMWVGLPAYLGWLLANLLLLLLFPIVFLIGVFGGAGGRRGVRRLLVGFLRVFFLRFFSWLGVYKVGALPKKEDFQSAKSHLFVANHRSWLDGLLLLALVPDVRIPVNRAYTKTPLIGSIMLWLGCIPLDRKSPELTLTGIASIRRAVAENENVVVFPEGTRSAHGRLRPFSGFFFRIACDEQAWITPIILHTEFPFLGPGVENLLTARCGELTIDLLPPIVPEEREKGAELARRVYKVMKPVLEKLDSIPDGKTNGVKKDTNRSP